MAIIFTYPTKATPALTDTVVITDSESEDPEDRTKQISIASIKTTMGVVDGTGTANTMPKWSDSNTLTDSPFTIDTSTSSLEMPTYIRHIGDTDSRFGFQGDNHFRVQTGGQTTIQSISRTDENNFTGQVAGLYFNSSQRLFTRGEGVEVEGSLFMPGYIKHVFDNDSYFGFSAGNNFILHTDSGRKIAAGPDTVTLYSDTSETETTTSVARFATATTGAIVYGQTVAAGAASERGGTIRYYNNANDRYVGISGPVTQGTSYQVRLPDSVGTAGQVLKLNTPIIGGSTQDLVWGDFGTGTVDKITKWSAGGTGIEDSIITEDTGGPGITIAGNVSVASGSYISTPSILDGAGEFGSANQVLSKSADNSFIEWATNNPGPGTGTLDFFPYWSSTTSLGDSQLKRLTDSVLQVTNGDLSLLNGKLSLTSGSGSTITLGSPPATGIGTTYLLPSASQSVAGYVLTMPTGTITSPYQLAWTNASSVTSTNNVTASANSLNLQGSSSVAPTYGAPLNISSSGGTGSGNQTAIYIDQSAAANPGGSQGVRMNFKTASVGILVTNADSQFAKVADFRNVSNQIVGTISCTSIATNYGSASDYRIKENVVDMTGAVERVKQLKPSRFNFTADPSKTVDGFLAHEAQEVVPESVTGVKDALYPDGDPLLQGIDQSKIVPLLTGAIKELISRIEVLEAK